MVKAEVKTPNKRKSIANETPSKKPKLEKSQKTPLKPFTPKKPNQGSPQKTTPKSFTPRNQNQQASNQKSNKKNKKLSESDSPKKVPFAGTKQLNNTKQGKPTNGTNTVSPNKDKKKRRNQFQGLISLVKTKQGTKDAELLKTLQEKIETFNSRPELSKTAKRKLTLLSRLKRLVEEGPEAVKAHKSNNSEVSQTKLKKNKQAQVQKAQLAPKIEVEEDSDDEEEAEEEESDEDASDDGAEEIEQNDDSDEEDDDDDDEEEEDDDDDDEEDEESDEAPAPQGKLIQQKMKPKQSTVIDKSKAVDINDLKKTELVGKGQKRFVLFVGNIPYDSTRQDLLSHFSKVGDIQHIRIPTEKGTNKPRGFAYVEVKDEITYQKCLSMHHSQLKGRRINVLYTQGGKKKGDERKNQIKVKNMKLHALRKQGKLAGSVKQSQKRSFRRNKIKQEKE